MNTAAGSVRRARFDTSNPFEQMERLAVARVIDTGADSVVLMLTKRADGEIVRVVCPSLAREQQPSVGEVVQVLLSQRHSGGGLRGSLVAGEALARVRALLAAQDSARACEARLHWPISKIGWRAEAEGVPAFLSLHHGQVAVNANGAVAREGDTVDAVISGYSRIWNCFTGLITSTVNRKVVVMGAMVQEFPDGAIVRGRVRGFAEYGAYVSIESKKHGATDVLLHNKEVAWERTTARDVLSEGEERDFLVVVKTSTADGSKQIELSLKRLKPWAPNLSEGMSYRGPVSRILDYGVFVEVAPGLDGLLHISNMSPPGTLGKVNERFEKGQMITVVVESIDFERRRIPLVQPHAPDEAISDGSVES
jgi:ribosomal protein S1